MDQFTSVALARTQARQQPTAELDVGADTPAEKGLVTVDERLTYAYGAAIPPIIAQFFSWKLSGIGVHGAYQANQQGKSIAQDINARADSARGRIAEVEQHCAELERRLPALRAEYAQACRQLAARMKEIALQFLASLRRPQYVQTGQSVYREEFAPRG